MLFGQDAGRHHIGYGRMETLQDFRDMKDGCVKAVMKP